VNRALDSEPRKERQKMGGRHFGFWRFRKNTVETHKGKRREPTASAAVPQIICTLLNESMLLERAAALEAAPYERTSARKSYAKGH
jgi:hypothetical protein